MSEPVQPPPEKSAEQQGEWPTTLLAGPAAHASVDSIRAGLRRARLELTVEHDEQARSGLEQLLHRLTAGAADDDADRRLVHGATLVELARARRRLGERDEVTQQLLLDALAAFEDAATPPAGAEALDHALALVAAGRTEAAVEQAARTQPDDLATVGLYVDLGAALLAAKQPAAASELLRRAAEIDPRAGTLTLLAETLAGEGKAAEAADQHTRAGTRLAADERYAEAVEAFDRSLRLRPDDLDTLIYRSEALRRAGQPEPGLREAERLLARAPQDPRLTATRAGALIDLERPREALAVLDEGENAAPASWHGLLAAQRALACVMLARYEEALAAAQRAVELGPENVAARALVADALMRLHRLDEALEAADEALSMDPVSLPALSARARALRQIGRVEEAVATLERALEITPDDGTLLAERGECLRLLGRYADARAALERAVALTPSSGWALGTLGQVLEELGSADEALDALQRASELDPSLGWVWESIGAQLQARGRADEALAAVEQGLTHVRTSALLGARAVLLMGVGRLADAEQAFHAALELEETAFLQERLGEALRQLERFDDALAALRRAVELEPGDAYAHGTIGQVLIARGEVDAGVTALRHGLELEPGSEWMIGTLLRALMDGGRFGEALELLAGPGIGDMSADTVVDLIAEVIGRAPPAQRVPLLAELHGRGEWAAGQLALAQHQVDAGRWSEAREAVDRALACAPEWPAALLQKGSLLQVSGDEDAALADVTAHLLRLTPDDAQAVGLEARRLQRAGRADEAERLLRAHLEGADGSSASEQLAELLRLQDKHEEALAVLDAAAERDALSVFGLGTRGQLLIALGRREDGVEALRAAHEQDPRVAWVAYELIAALLEAQRELDALVVAERAAAAPDASPLLQGLPAMALFPLGEFDAAAAACARAIEAGAELSWLCAMRGWVALLRGRPQEALAHFSEAVKLPDTEIDHCRGIAESLRRADRGAEARERFAKLLEEASATPRTFDQIALAGWCLFRLERYDEATAALEEALAIDSLSASAQLDLALVTLHAGAPRAAVSEYGRGIDVAVHNEDLRARSTLHFALFDLRDALARSERLAAEPAAHTIEEQLATAVEQADRRYAERRANGS